MSMAINWRVGVIAATILGLSAPAMAQNFPERRSSAYLLGYVKSELEKWGKPIRESGAIPNE